MAFLIIAGITVTVASPNAAKEIERVGTSGRSFDGTLRSAIRSEKRTWTVTTSLMLDADATTLENSFAFASQVTCSGDLLGGSVLCEVTVTGQAYPSVSASDGKSFMRQLQLSIREV